MIARLPILNVATERPYVVALTLRFSANPFSLGHCRGGGLHCILISRPSKRIAHRHERDTPIGHPAIWIELKHLLEGRNGMVEPEGMEQGHRTIEFALRRGIAGDGEVYLPQLFRPAPDGSWPFVLRSSAICSGAGSVAAIHAERFIFFILALLRKVTRIGFIHAEPIQVQVWTCWFRPLDYTDCMKGYGSFCPVAKAAEILAERWTLLVLRDILLGSRRFNDLRRGVPRIPSQTLSAKRLQTLVQAGIIERRPTLDGHGWEYCPTRACEDLHPVIE